MKRPRVKRTKELVASGGDVYVLRPTEESDLRIEQPDERARALLRALDGSRTAAELEREFGSERVADALAVLADAELLDDAADDERVPPRTLARHDRQLRYFSEAGDPAIAPSEYQRRLRAARVAMLGAGGLWSWASYALACCGIGELVFAWQGGSSPEAPPGCEAVAKLDVFAPVDGGLYSRARVTHRQRHFPRERVEALLARAGLECVSVHGVLPDCSLVEPADEAVHPKVVYTATRMRGGDDE